MRPSRKSLDAGFGGSTGGIVLAGGAVAGGR
jgi:hypothetical protein